MPKGPQGQTRPADLIGCAVAVARIATGEAEDDRYMAPGRARSGQAGAIARSKNLTSERKKEIAHAASNRRWAVGD